MNEESGRTAPEAIVRLAKDAYFAMTDREISELDDETIEDVLAAELLALEALVELRRRDGDAALFLTLTRIEEEEPGAVQLLAAQAIVELDCLAFGEAGEAAEEDSADEPAA